MNDIKYEAGITIEELVKEINNRLELIRTMHKMNNDNIHIIDGNFRRVFQEFEKLSDKIDKDVVDRLKDLQNSFTKLKKEGDNPEITNQKQDS